MNRLYYLTETQIEKIRPYFPLSHGIARVNDRKMISGIIYVIKNSLQWKDAHHEFGSHKTLYNRFIRWSHPGVFNNIFAELAKSAKSGGKIMIDATHLKARRTAASPLKKGIFPAVLEEQKAD